MKTKKREREELGVQLYGVQQELARQQMLLEKEHDSFNMENQKRSQSEYGLEETKNLHKQVVDDLNHQRKRGEHCCLVAHQMQVAHAVTGNKLPCLIF